MKIQLIFIDEKPTKMPIISQFYVQWQCTHRPPKR